MRVIFFFFRSKYRYSHTGRLFKSRKSGDFILIPVVGAASLFLHPLLRIIGKIIGADFVYTDKEFESSNGLFRLWWNTPEEMGNGHIYRSPLMMCDNPIDKNIPRLQIYPVTSKGSIAPNFHDMRVVYFGGFELPDNPDILIGWEVWRDSILNDMAMITDREFWRLNFKDRSILERYEYYRGFSNLIRLEGISRLVDSGAPVEIYGDDWKDICISYKKSNYKKELRSEVYRGNLCIDFGSKSGSNSLYQRSNEIIESSGLLLQVRRRDSQEMYGSGLVDDITFSSLDEMISKIGWITRDVPYAQDVQARLMRQFYVNKNYDPRSKNSLASVLGGVL